MTKIDKPAEPTVKRRAAILTERERRAQKGLYGIHDPAHYGARVTYQSPLYQPLTQPVAVNKKP